MRRSISLFVAITAALLIAAPTVSANNDPHRYPVPDGYTQEVDPGICGFPAEIVYHGNAYERDAPDGSLVTVTGYANLTIANLHSGKAIDLLASGPARVTIAPDGSSVQFSRGLGTLFDPALTSPSFGFPSNFVYLAGAMWVSRSAEGAITAIGGNPRVMMNVCEALS
jgi:hypothetical protein